jgi:hypothetical protein
MHNFSIFEAAKLKSETAKVFKIKLLHLINEFKRIPELKEVDIKNIEQLLYVLENSDLELNYLMRYTLFQGKHILNRYLGYSDNLNDIYLIDINLDDNKPNRLCQLWIYKVISLLPSIISKPKSIEASFIIENPQSNFSIELSKTHRIDFKISLQGQYLLSFSLDQIHLQQISGKYTAYFNWDNESKSNGIKLHTKPYFQFEHHCYSLPFTNFSSIVGSFVETAVIRSENFVDIFSIQLFDAFSLLKKLGFSEIFDFFNAILPFYTYKSYHNSSSPEELSGLILIPSTNEFFPNGVEIMAECILHEALHNTLYHLEESTRFYLDKTYLDEIYLSPWRREPRPMRMIVHGCFVFAPIAFFWLKLLLENRNDKNMLFHVILRLNQVEFGLEILKNYARFDTVGLMVLNSLDDLTSQIRDFLKDFDIIEIEKSVVEGLNKHKEQYNYKH